MTPWRKEQKKSYPVFIENKYSTDFLLVSYWFFFFFSIFHVVVTYDLSVNKLVPENRSNLKSRTPKKILLPSCVVDLTQCLIVIIF